MKAILVIDMPECCAECPLMLWDAESEYYGACCPTLKEVNCVADSYKENENKGTKPNWCPLKPAPSEYAMSRGDSIDDCAWFFGYNKCVREIIGNDSD